MPEDDNNNPPPKILICVDIDQSLIDFHGDNFIGSKKDWQDHFKTLFDIITACGAQPLLAVVTSKTQCDELVDKVVDAFFDQFHQSNSKVFPIDDSERSYFYQHVTSNDGKVISSVNNYCYELDRKNLYIQDTADQKPLIRVMTGLDKYLAIHNIAHAYNVNHNNIIFYDDSPEVLNITQKQLPDLSTVSAQVFNRYAHERRPIPQSIIDNNIDRIRLNFKLAVLQVLDNNNLTLTDTSKKHLQQSTYNKEQLTLAWLNKYCQNINQYLSVTEDSPHVRYCIDNEIRALENQVGIDITEESNFKQRLNQICQTFLDKIQNYIEHSDWNKTIHGFREGKQITQSDNSTQNVPEGIKQIHDILQNSEKPLFDKLKDIYQITKSKHNNCSTTYQSSWFFASRDQSTHQFYQHLAYSDLQTLTNYLDTPSESPSPKP